MMRNKIHMLKALFAVILLASFSLLHVGTFSAQSLTQSLSVDSAKDSGSNLYFSISMAILLTFLTVFAITLLARFIREVSGDSYNKIEDSEH